MKKRSILFSAICCLLGTISYAATFNNIIVFGDSLSDNGNLYQYTNQSYPPSPPYFDGHFSNGKIWIEYLAEAFFPINPYDHLKSYAFGGAGVATDEGAYFSLQAEIETYLTTNNGKADPDSLFFVWIGSNNYFGLIEEENAKDLIEKTTTDVISALQKSLHTLSKAGAKKIVILNLPDLGKTPANRNNAENQSILSEASVRHNTKLQTLLHELKIQYPETQWIFADAYQAFYTIIFNPEQFGFTNITEPCLQSNPVENNQRRHAPMLKYTIPVNINHNLACDEFVFFDPVHPTTRFHTFIAQLTKEAIEKI